MRTTTALLFLLLPGAFAFAQYQAPPTPAHTASHPVSLPAPPLDEAAPWWEVGLAIDTGEDSGI